MKQHRFERSMLSGHPGNVTDAVKKLIVRGVNAGLVVTSTTDGVHSPTSFHFGGRAVDFGLRRDLIGTTEGRERMVRFQRFLIREFGPDAFDEIFGPDNHANAKAGVRISLLEGTSLETLHDNHVHVAPRRMTLPKAPPPGVDELARRAREHGARYERRIIHEARRADLPIPLAFAVIEQESNFRNVWGGDPTPNGRTAGLQGKRVTRDRYLAYRQERGAKGRGGMQGVGPAQLTWWELQDEADRLGGCWKVSPNLCVAFAHLAVLVAAHGETVGIAKYNGSGPAAARYSREVRAKRDRWAKRLGV